MIYNIIVFPSGIVQLEGEFNIMLDIDDIIDMSSVSISKNILSKYDIDFSQ